MTIRPTKWPAGRLWELFMGITPGEGVLSTLFFAYIFRLNRLAALAGVLAFNMWTTVLALAYCRNNRRLDLSCESANTFQ